MQLQTVTYRQPLGGAGTNRPVLAETADHDTVVFKHNAYGVLGELSPEQGRARDRNEVMGAKIVESFGLSALPSEEALLDDGHGHRTLGIVAPFLHDLHTLGDSPLSFIQKPEEAVQQCVVKTWLGDPDFMLNNNNVWILADGTPLAAEDFGYAFRPGLRLVGMPRTNLEIMRAWARPETVEPILDRIRLMSDADIENLVDGIGRSHISDWTPALERQYAGVLEHNRELLRADNPLAEFYPGHRPGLPERLRNQAWELTLHVARPLSVGVSWWQHRWHHPSGQSGQLP